MIQISLNNNPSPTGCFLTAGAWKPLPMLPVLLTKLIAPWRPVPAAPGAQREIEARETVSPGQWVPAFPAQKQGDETMTMQTSSQKCGMKLAAKFQ